MLNPVNKQHNLDNLREITNVIPIDFDYFIFYGTLLGYRREKSILQNDDDIDIYMDIKHKREFTDIVRSKLSSFQINKVGLCGVIYEEFRSFIQLEKQHDGTPTFADFYFYTNKPEDNFIYEEWTSLQPGCDFPVNIPKDIIFPLQNKIMEDISLKVPSDIDSCCKLIYGDTYMTPLQKKSTGHAVQRGNYTMFEALKLNS